MLSHKDYLQNVITKAEKAGKFTADQSQRVIDVLLELGLEDVADSFFKSAHIRSFQYNVAKHDFKYALKLLKTTINKIKDKNESISNKEIIEGLNKIYEQENLGINRLEELRKIAKEGLDPIYKGNIRSWQYDFYPGFSWTSPDQQNEIRWVLNNPEFPEISKAFEAKVGFDIKADLEAALKESEDYDKEKLK